MPTPPSVPKPTAAYVGARKRESARVYTHNDTPDHSTQASSVQRPPLLNASLCVDLFTLKYCFPPSNEELFARVQPDWQPEALAVSSGPQSHRSYGTLRRIVESVSSPTASQ
eukprot:scaffold51211_cov35-Tisochrysis_lutea.AAC.1